MVGKNVCAGKKTLTSSPGKSSVIVLENPGIISFHACMNHVTPTTQLKISNIYSK
jgi:hypothetical protein